MDIDHYEDFYLCRFSHDRNKEDRAGDIDFRGCSPNDGNDIQEPSSAGQNL